MKDIRPIKAFRSARATGQQLCTFAHYALRKNNSTFVPMRTSIFRWAVHMSK
jgi:hypothetical protein